MDAECQRWAFAATRDGKIEFAAKEDRNCMLADGRAFWSCEEKAPEAVRAAIREAVMARTKEPEVDPIFEAIETHRSLAQAYNAAIEQGCRLENELPKERRRSQVGFGELVESDDPRWIANEQAVLDLNEKMDHAACQMLDILPTTMNGVRALLGYATEIDRLDESGFGWPTDLMDEKVVKPRLGGHSWWFFMADNLANALARIPSGS
jgi:hypothetical protein